jgi:hypothetical protein
VVVEAEAGAVDEVETAAIVVDAETAGSRTPLLSKHPSFK